jgi:pantetheine-phosphate adenylyltransferase
MAVLNNFETKYKTSMTKIAVFPGSFDPITKGHVALVERALPLFDKIIIAIGNNSQKNYLFNLQKRKEWLQEVFKNLPNVSIASYSGLTIEFCKAQEANYILRGLRNSNDFEFEKNIAQMNYSMNNNIETIFLITQPELSAINSSIIRDIIKNKGNASEFVPDVINLYED